MAKKAMIKNMCRKINQARQDVPWVVQLWQVDESQPSSGQTHPALHECSCDGNMGLETHTQEKEYFYGWDGGVKKAWRRAAKGGQPEWAVDVVTECKQPDDPVTAVFADGSSKRLAFKARLRRGAGRRAQVVRH